ncbi:unnamed protein product [Moneuplotes crassus]|uniref:Uncharacterized protein n=1 Tax=Euplotes crassus TaxID=5936 RepID=A0AAD1X859_EUPCR|nr:unnamed protein product [Moneuplotes crassus]
MDLDNLLLKLGICINIMQYYGNSNECKKMMSLVSKGTNKFYGKNSKALKRGFRKILTLEYGFGKETEQFLEEEISGILGDASRKGPRYSAYNLEVIIRCNEELFRLRRFVEEVTNPRLLCFNKIIIPVTISKHSCNPIEFYPPTSEVPSLPIIRELYHTLFSTDIDTSCIKFTTWYRTSRSSGYHPPYPYPNMISPPLSNGYVAPFSHYFKTAKLEIHDEEDLETFRDIDFDVEELILDGRLFMALFEFGNVYYTSQNLRSRTQALTVKLKGIGGLFGVLEAWTDPKDIQGEEANNILTKEGCEIMFGNLKKFTFQKHLESQEVSFVDKVRNNSSLIFSSLTQSDINFCMIENEQLTKDEGEDNPIEVYCYSPSSKSYHSFRVSKVEINGAPLRVYPTSNYIQVDYIKCNFYDIHQNNKIDITSFEDFVTSITINPLVKTGFEDDEHGYRNLAETYEELERTVFIKCDSISLVSGCKAMCTLADEAYYVYCDHSKENNFHTRVQKFEFTGKEFFEMNEFDQEDFVERLKPLSFPSGLTFTSLSHPASFMQLLSCLKLPITDLTLTLADDEMPSDSFSKQRLRKLLLNKELENFKLNKLCGIQLKEVGRISPIKRGLGVGESSNLAKEGVQKMVDSFLNDSFEGDN